MQKNSLSEDLPETVRRLDAFLPFDSGQMKALAGRLNELGCRLVVCDIAPMGIAVARAAGIPAVLVENFTWDWIYEGYLPQASRLGPHISYLRQVFTSVDYHLQAEPICAPGQVDLTALPVSRKIRTPAGPIRQELGIAEGTKAVLLTMGGVPWEYTFLEQLTRQHGIDFIIPGTAERLERRDNLVLLPHQSDIFHPDLVNACDAVIGKIGYSTLAEVYQAGAPFGYVVRPMFRESLILADYIQREMSGLPIDEAQFENGSWLARLPDLLALPHLDRRGPNGATQIADFLWDILHREN